jgi:hypothetical protein
VPNRPTPIATHAHTFIPVNGRLPLWLPDEGPGSLGDELDALVDVGGAEESVPLVVGDDELELELELELDEDPVEPEPVEPVFDELLGCVVVLDPVSGSTYC